LIRCLGHTPKEFLSAISRQEQPIAIDWGFPLFKQSGFAIWWFDGDRNAARQLFVQRGTVPLERFTVQMQSIEEEWSRIEDVTGDNIINVVTAGPTQPAPEYI